MLTTIIFNIFLACIGLELLNYFFFYSKLAFGQNIVKKQIDRNQKSVSLIVYIKDQQDILENYLPTLLQQNHPSYEIILVNNASCDESLDILEAFEKTHPKIKLVNVLNNEAFWNNKKYALTLGIKVAKYDHFVFTEPQASITDPQWLNTLASYFSDKKQIVIGHSSILKKKGSFFNALQRYSNTLKTIQLVIGSSFSSVLHGNSKNQGYTKDLFYSNNGFIQQMRTPFGDQYSFIEQISNKKNTAIATDPISFVYIEPEKKYSTWIDNMKTELLLLKAASFKHKLINTIFTKLRILFYLSFIICLFINTNWQIVIALFFFRMLVVYIYNYRLFKQFLNKDLIWIFPLLELIHIFITSYYSLTQLITGRKLEREHF